MDRMFKEATAFNQNMCPWMEKIPYIQNTDIFSGSGCTYKTTPSSSSASPYCAAATHSRIVPLMYPLMNHLLPIQQLSSHQHRCRPPLIQQLPNRWLPSHQQPNRRPALKNVALISQQHRRSQPRSQPRSQLLQSTSQPALACCETDPDVTAKLKTYQWTVINPTTAKTPSSSCPSTRAISLTSTTRPIEYWQLECGGV